jgi:hypothetical protein
MKMFESKTKYKLRFRSKNNIYDNLLKNDKKGRKHAKKTHTRGVFDYERTKYNYISSLTTILQFKSKNCNRLHENDNLFYLSHLL